MRMWYKIYVYRYAKNAKIGHQCNIDGLFIYGTKDIDSSDIKEKVCSCLKEAEPNMCLLSIIKHVRLKYYLAIYIPTKTAFNF